MKVLFVSNFCSHLFLILLPRIGQVAPFRPAPAVARTARQSTRLLYRDDRETQEATLIVPQEDISSEAPEAWVRDSTTASIGPMEAIVTKATMVSYIASMCLALPAALLPIALLHQSKLVTKSQSEHLALTAGQACARSLFAIMPFCDLTISGHKDENPEPTIWVANHVSQIDTFLLLVADLELRGSNKRPIKVIYWKGLDENPITRMFFHMAGFIPVDMEANGAGVPNVYDQNSFKSMLRQTKRALQEGFDVLMMPEGQLNPTPEKGLLPVFGGACKSLLIIVYCLTTRAS